MFAVYATVACAGGDKQVPGSSVIAAWAGLFAALVPPALLMLLVDIGRNVRKR